MGSEWQIYPLEDCMAAIIDYRGKTPRKTSSGIPLVTAKIVKSGRIESPREFIDPGDFDSWTRRGMPRPGDVVVTTEAPLGEVAQLGTERVALAQRLIGLRGKPDLLDNRFLKYVLQSNAVQEQLRARATGTTVLGIKQSELRKVSLALPPLDVQCAIASILGALDDKIELNRRMSRTLDKMAQAVFKSWFVDFDRTQETLVSSDLGAIPASWRVRSVGEVAEVIDCLHSKKPERRESGLPYLQLNNIQDDGLLNTSNTYFISDEDYRRWTSRMEAREGDCVITNVGRSGATAQVPSGRRAALGRNMTGVRPHADFPYPTFLVELLRSPAMKAEISLKLDSGTILDALNVRSIPRLRFSMPPADLLAEFEGAIRPIRRRMELLLMQSWSLAELRDALLPRLLSGTLEVDRSV